MADPTQPLPLPDPIRVMVMCVHCNWAFCIQVQPSQEWMRFWNSSDSEGEYDGPPLVRVLHDIPHDAVPMEGSCVSMADDSQYLRPRPPQTPQPGSDHQSHEHEANEVMPLQNAPPQEQTQLQLQPKAGRQAECLRESELRAIEEELAPLEDEEEENQSEEQEQPGAEPTDEDIMTVPDAEPATPEATDEAIMTEPCAEHAVPKATHELIMTEVKALAPVDPAWMGGTAVTKGAPVFPPLPPPSLLRPPAAGRGTDNDNASLMARLQALIGPIPKKRPRPKQSKASKVSETVATAKSSGSGSNSNANDAASLCEDAPWRRKARKF